MNSVMENKILNNILPQNIQDSVDNVNSEWCNPYTIFSLNA